MTDDLIKMNVSAVNFPIVAQFQPSNGSFTRTVTVGDTGVLISMTGDSSAGTTQWRKDGGPKISSQQGSLQYSFSNPIQASDEGIYEIHYDGERSTGRGGIVRLIVRGEISY